MKVKIQLMTIRRQADKAICTEIRLARIEVNYEDKL